MQAKPLAITFIVLALLAFAADSWLAQSTSASVVIEQSQLVSVPSRQALQRPDSSDEVQGYSFIIEEDSLETTRTVAQKLKDLTLVTTIQKKLFRIKELSAVDVNVESENGIVVLAGSVASEKEQQRILGVVRRITGVKSVTNNIEVQQVKPATSGSSSG